MSESLADVQQSIAVSPTSSAAFRQLSRDREGLLRFVRRLDPDEVADVLGVFIFLGLARAVL